MSKSPTLDLGLSNCGAFTEGEVQIRLVRRGLYKISKLGGECPVQAPYR